MNRRPGKKAASSEAATDPSKADRDLAALFDRHRASLLSFCRKHLRNRGDADDLVQDVFHAVMRRGDGAAIRRPRAYLFQTAMNLIRNKRERDRCRRVHAQVGLDDVGDPGLIGTVPSAETVVAARQDMAAVMAVLDGLPQEVRAVFWLKRCLGYSYKEIADRLGIPVRRVNKHM